MRLRTSTLPLHGEKLRSGRLAQARKSCARWEGCITMLITRIELENIKSYCHTTVDFRRGTTAISGPNGAGKTTIVEAIGFPLFDYLSFNHSHFLPNATKSGHLSPHITASDTLP